MDWKGFRPGRTFSTKRIIARAILSVLLQGVFVSAALKWQVALFSMAALISPYIFGAWIIADIAFSYSNLSKSCNLIQKARLEVEDGLLLAQRLLEDKCRDLHAEKQKSKELQNSIRDLKLKESNIQNLKEELVEAQSRIDHLEEYRVSAEKLESQLREISASSQESLRELNVLIDQKGKLQSQVTQLNDYVLKLQSRIAYYEKAEQVAEGAKDELSALKIDVQSKKIELSHLTSTQEALRKEVDNLRLTIEQYKRLNVESKMNEEALSVRADEWKRAYEKIKKDYEKMMLEKEELDHYVEHGQNIYQDLIFSSESSPLPISPKSNASSLFSAPLPITTLKPISPPSPRDIQPILSPCSTISPTSVDTEISPLSIGEDQHNECFVPDLELLISSRQVTEEFIKKLESASQWDIRDVISQLPLSRLAYCGNGSNLLRFLIHLSRTHGRDFMSFLVETWLPFLEPRIVQLAKHKFASFVVQELEQDPRIRSLLLSQSEESLIELVYHKPGNYIFRRLVEYSTSEERKYLFRTFKKAHVPSDDAKIIRRKLTQLFDLLKTSSTKSGTT